MTPRLGIHRLVDGAWAPVAPSRGRGHLAVTTVAAAILLLAGLSPRAVARADQPSLRIGSKAFTESVILGEIVAAALRAADIPAEHRRELGGTQILFQALEHGDIDIYPEYTGTIRYELLPELRRAAPVPGAPPAEASDQQPMQQALARRGLAMTRSLGFNNTYALGVSSSTAARHGLLSISDLRRHPELRFGLTSEFLDRADGWPGLRARYRLPQRNVRGMVHDVAYRALLAREVDVTDLYSTDAEIPEYRLIVLRDDLEYFPEYHAVLLYRAALERTHPRAVAALQELAGAIDEPRMRQMNARVKIERASESLVAADFLRDVRGHDAAAAESRWPRRVLQRTAEHLALVGIAVGACIAVAVPLGVVAFRRLRTGHAILALAGIIQTIPALALLVLMIPILGIAAPPAVAALFLYGLLPIIRNTHAGLAAIPTPLRESALALGLDARGRLWRVELPLASRSILAGIKTSAVITVGFATLGALIGAGGYGQPILTGIRLNDHRLILEGAIPAALLALLVQGLFELMERWIVPRGLRIRMAA